MKQQRIRLVYFSRNLIKGDRSDVVEQIFQILTASRRNNLQRHITGALLFNSGCFAQCLEGRREDVEELFKRIQKDSRHIDIQMLSVELIDVRIFPGWSMGFLGKSRTYEQLFGHICPLPKCVF
ncbi:BLUF domain-containing protein [Rhodoblastus acidophilus]|uniref:BLUF domain-containing protein n=1 Tax=Rhodoblastus acidophilus TaxID=1074 RepID=UPI003CD01198